jgi:putative membrane protein
MPRRSLILLALVGAALAASAGSAVAAERYSPLDEHSLQSSIQGDRFEIRGGKLAESGATNPTVRALGARLVKDHLKSLGEAVRLAHRLHISVPKTPTTSQEWEIAILQRFAGAPQFNGWYSKLEVQDHKQDIDESKDEVSKGTNLGVRRLARQDLPVLRLHLRRSYAALSASGG